MPLIPNTAWLDDHLLVGTGAETEPPPESVNALLSAGIYVFGFLELTRASLDIFDAEQPDPGIDDKSVSIQYWLLAFDETGVPKRKLTRCLADIREIVEGGVFVYLHGTQPPGNGALVGACWLLDHGKTLAQTLDKVNEVYGGSVLNSAQRAYVDAFAHTVQN